MITLQFKHCKVFIWHEQHRLVTVFEDGAELTACPNYDPESVSRSHSLGYCGDVWAMTVDHEVGHTILAEMDNLDFSPALWAAAHPTEPRTRKQKAAFKREEKRVLELQRFSRLLTQKLSS